MSATGWALEASYRALPAALYEDRAPTPVKAPATLLWNRGLAAELGLEEQPAEVLAGNRPLPGWQPIAQAYAGHQFGHPAMLGDGRAVLLGEGVTPAGQRFDVQLKGAGRTRYSRSGDGRAALGPMLREYVVSEAMAALGVPTTRSLAVVATGEPVLRDRLLQGAILVRVAASHVRVGTFQFAAALDGVDVLRALADHAMARHDPDLAPGDYRGFLARVAARQCALVVEWMRVGFVHGVMNTDNMAISGETIDYGPCAFLETYGPDVVFSSIDTQGRYAFGNQPRIALWNLARLAESLLPLLGATPEAGLAAAREVLDGFPAAFAQRFRAMMGRKLGFEDAEPRDDALIAEVLGWLAAAGLDHCNFFRTLADALEAGAPLDAPWWPALRDRVGAGAAALIRAAAPAVIPRNHLVEAALAAAEGGDLAPVRALLAACAAPYRETPENAAFRRPAAPGEVVRQTFCGT